MHVNSNKFSFMILSIKLCNINDNSQCDEKVIRFYFFASVNISNSIFFGNNATYLCEADSSHAIFRDSYTDSLNETKGSVIFEEKRILRNFQNITVLDPAICIDSNICQYDQYTYDIYYYFFSIKPFLGLFMKE